MPKKRRSNRSRRHSNRPKSIKTNKRRKDAISSKITTDDVSKIRNTSNEIEKAENEIEKIVENKSESHLEKIKHFFWKNKNETNETNEAKQLVEKACQQLDEDTNIDELRKLAIYIGINEAHKSSKRKLCRELLSGSLNVFGRDFIYPVIRFGFFGFFINYFLTNLFDIQNILNSILATTGYILPITTIWATIKTSAILLLLTQPFAWLYGITSIPFIGVILGKFVALPIIAKILTIVYVPNWLSNFLDKYQLKTPTWMQWMSDKILPFERKSKFTLLKETILNQYSSMNKFQVWGINIGAFYTIYKLYLFIINKLQRNYLYWFDQPLKKVHEPERIFLLFFKDNWKKTK
jgi:hypothetical protein